ncbi:phosphatase inhibitor-domain-containing protein [Abortiporus biennis]|nr:phosphatase inhibitor-domain-containing protein [Abortiporus biennis]
MSYLATRGGPSTASPNDGSRTITIRDSQPIEEEDGSADNEVVGTIDLVGGSNRANPRVVWSEDVVDNESLGKKSSKICCIYHKPKRFDESSSEESSSDSDSDSSCGGHDHQHNRRRVHRHHHRPHDSNSNGDSGSSNMRNRDGGDSTVHELDKEPDEPNVYEKVPKGKGKGKHVEPKS